MKLIKALLVMTLMFFAATSVYAVVQNDDAPCTAVSTADGDDQTSETTNTDETDTGTDIAQ
jgi:hypothetical protein